MTSEEKTIIDNLIEMPEILNGRLSDTFGARAANLIYTAFNHYFGRHSVDLEQRARDYADIEYKNHLEFSNRVYGRIQDAYLAGSCDLKIKQEWVSVEDGLLPDAYQFCLIVMDGVTQNLTVQFMKTETDEVWRGEGESPEYWFEFSEGVDDPQVRIEQVSHWRPVPSAPNK